MIATKNHSSDIHRKKMARITEKDSTELELEAFLFGDMNGDGFVSKILSNDSDEAITNKDVSIDTVVEDSSFFYIDTNPVHAQVVSEEHTPEDDKQAAWVDEDDENVVVNIVAQDRLKKLRTSEEEEYINGKEYEQRLRNQFEKLYPKPEWADTLEDEEHNNLFTTANNLLAASQRVLKPDEIEITRLRNVNHSEPCQSVVTGVEWHPSSQIVAVIGLDKTLRLFSADGTKLQSVHFKDTPLTTARWLPNGREIIVSGRRKFFFSYNIETETVKKIPYLRGRQEKSLEKFEVSPCGRFIVFYGDEGEIILVSASDKQCMGSLKMNGTVRAIDFSRCGNYMYSTGGDGEIYTWDLKSRRCIRRFSDNGTMKNSVLAVSEDNEYLATGDFSGIVHLHKLCNISSTPFKSITNLTTSVDLIKFNHDSQLMAIGSRVMKNQFRLVHLPTGRVYSNWPSAGMSLGYVQACNFSPDGKSLAVGNDKGHEKMNNGPKLIDLITPKFSPRLYKIKEIFIQNGIPLFQWRNVIKAIHQKNQTKFSELQFLSKVARSKLIDAFESDVISTLTLAQKIEAKQCKKMLLSLKDQSSIESVWMSFVGSHNSVCISSQVGCALKCAFCATGAAGFKRQLESDEIVDQIHFFQHIKLPVHTVSFMGMGEALQNPRTFDALKMLTHKEICNIADRKISVSTVGVIPGIERLTQEFPQVNLAFSLHSPFDEQRSELVPMNKTFPLADCIKVLNKHALLTKRKVMLAYLILPGYNDSKEHAKGVIQLIKGMSKTARALMHVNLLRYNPTEVVEMKFVRSEAEHIDPFMEMIKQAGISVTLRQSFGVDIDAACGQLFNTAQKLSLDKDKLLIQQQ